MVPASFDDLGVAINTVYAKLVEEGTIKVRDEGAVPTIPVDYDWARKLGMFLERQELAICAHSCS